MYGKLMCCLLLIGGVTGFGYGSNPKDSLESEASQMHGRYSTYFIPIQYAGNIGMVSSGLGYAAAKDNYQLSLVYGYTPQSAAGVRIHTITARNVFHLAHFYLHESKMVVPYLALGASIELGGRSFFSLPSNMPEGYYHFPKSIHAIPAAGLKLRKISRTKQFFSGAEFFAEASTVDVYVWYKIVSNEVKMSQIFTLSVGVNLLRN